MTKQAKVHPFAIQRRICQQAGVTHPVIFDVGARAGEPTLSYLKAMPKATVYGFEPEPQAYTELVQMFGKEGRVKLYKLALMDRSGEAELYLHGGGTDSFLKRIPWPIYYPPDKVSKETVTVELTTLDSFCGEHGVAPDILKLDTQGTELAALMGAQETLSTVKCIYCEVSFTPIYQEGPMYHHIAQFMEDAGFRLFRIYFMTHAKDGQARQGDALFVNTRYEKRREG